ncbi:uncharacterized protein [Periplaneta americana]|uniref:uncharacterized protein isoform X3 n=1 Tax=Periplaneta americana TaxID=6978 RepID=UPI0037E981A8
MTPKSSDEWGFLVGVKTENIDNDMKKHHFPNAIAETIEERLCFKRRAEAWNYSTSTPAGRCSEARIPDIASLTPVDWVKNVMEKRQKLKNVILEISRLNDMIMLMRKEVLAPKQTAQSISTGRRHGQPSGLRVS